jgi:hypothetical protein
MLRAEGAARHLPSPVHLGTSLCLFTTPGELVVTCHFVALHLQDETNTCPLRPCLSEFIFYSLSKKNKIGSGGPQMSKLRLVVSGG